MYRDTDAKQDTDQQRGSQLDLFAVVYPGRRKSMLKKPECAIQKTTQKSVRNIRENSSDERCQSKYKTRTRHIDWDKYFKWQVKQLSVCKKHDQDVFMRNVKMEKEDIPPYGLVVITYHICPKCSELSNNALKR